MRLCVGDLLGNLVFLARQIESTDHLFYRCVFALHVWNKVRERIGFPKRTLAIRSSMKWIRRLYSGNRKHSKGMAIVVACSVYHIWRHRNAVIHDESCALLDGLVHVILTDVYRVVFSFPG
nr:uncharacterized protein LOC109177999 [Ipomoea batatas]